MKNNIVLMLRCTTFIAILFLVNSCKKDDDIINKEKVITSVLIDNENSKSTQICNFEYKNNLISKLVFIEDGVELTYIYYFDNNNNKLLSIKEGISNEVFVKLIYSNSKVDSLHLSSNKYKVELDNNGLVKTLTKNRDSQFYDNSALLTFTYDVSRNLIQMGDGKNKYEYKIEYDNKNNSFKSLDGEFISLFQIYSSSVLNLSIFPFFVSQNSNNIKKITEIEDGRIVSVTDYNYKYDEKGYPNSVTINETKNNVVTNMGKLTFTYLPN